MSEHAKVIEALMHRRSDCYDFTLDEHNALLAAIAELRTPQPVTPAGGEVWHWKAAYEATALQLYRRMGKSVDDATQCANADVANRTREIAALLPDTHPPVADAALVRDAQRLLRSADALAACVMSVDGYSRGELIAFAENFRNDVAALNQRGGGNER